MTRPLLPPRRVYVPNYRIYNPQLLPTIDYYLVHLRGLAGVGHASLPHAGACRPHQAAELRQKASHIQAMDIADQRGEEYPLQEARLRYIDYENTIADQGDRVACQCETT
jgi:hypothetical protein